MAISYTLATVEKMLNTVEYYVKHQTVLDGTEQLPESYYKFKSALSVNLQNGEESKISIYDAYQDVRQNRYGKQFGQFFYWYLEPHEFYMYYVHRLNLMIFATGKATVDAFLRQMGDDTESGFICKRINVDFCQIQPLLPIINGAWFAELQRKKQFLKTAGLFGYNVDRSDEFQAAAEAGVISSLCIPYSYKSREVQIAITKSGSVVFYGRIKNPVTKQPDIQSEIELVLDIYQKYLVTRDRTPRQGQDIPRHTG